MRLPEARIKEAILHPEKLVRQAALDYFADTDSPDPDVMPLAIQAIEKFGRDGAFQFLHSLSYLAQTEATVAWAIQELGKNPERDYREYLSRILGKTAPRLLARKEADILKAPGLASQTLAIIRERIELMSWSAEQCWAELERISAAGQATFSREDFDFNRAERIAEALVPQAGPLAERILAFLAQQIAADEIHPHAWMLPLVVEVAGRMKLESAIPLLIRNLREGDELGQDDSMWALARIGTDQTAGRSI